MRACLLLLALLVPMLAESVAGLKWTASAGWQNEGSRPMRAATYRVAEGAECVVYFFGAGQGGNVDANVERWKGQFHNAPNPKVNKRTLHGLPVTSVDISGEYSGMSGPMMQNAKPQPGYRLLGAIVEGPAGNVFVKFTGPVKTVAANEPKFNQLLDSFRKE